MAFIAITELPNPHPEFTDDRGLRASRAFSVYAQSEQQAREIVWIQRGFRLGAVYRNTQGNVVDSYCICRGIETEFKSGRPAGGAYAEFIVSLYFAYPPGGLGQTPVFPGGPPEWMLEGEFINKPIDHDRDGQPIVNPVNEPVDPPLSGYFYAESAIVEAYWPATDQATIWNKLRPFVRRVNHAEYKGYPARSLLCFPFEVKRTDFISEAGLNYFLVRGTFKFAEPQSYYNKSFDAWDDVVIGKGRRLHIADDKDGRPVYQVITQDGKPIEEGGVPISEPVLLSADGVTRLPTGATPALLAFKKYFTANFDTLGF